MKTLVLLAALLYCASAVSAKNAPVKIPSFVKLCNRDQPDFDECLQSSLQDLFPKFAKGVKELDLVPMDPLLLEEAFFTYGAGAFQGKTLLKPSYTHGLGSAKFLDINTNFEDPNKILIEAIFHIDHAHVAGQYKQQGKFLNLMNLNGKGNFNVSTEDVHMTWKITGALVDRDGSKYLNVKEFLVTPEVGNMVVDATNLFDGNEALSKAILGMVNQHWRSTYYEMLPFTQIVWDKLFRQIANRVFSRVPFDQLFPTSQ